MRYFTRCSRGNVCCWVAPAWDNSDLLSIGEILQNKKLETGTYLCQSRECGEEGGAQRLLLGRWQQSPTRATAQWWRAAQKLEARGQLAGPGRGGVWDPSLSRVWSDQGTPSRLLANLSSSSQELPEEYLIKAGSWTSALWWKRGDGEKGPHSLNSIAGVPFYIAVVWQALSLLSLSQGSRVQKWEGLSERV